MREVRKERGRGRRERGEHVKKSGFRSSWRVEQREVAKGGEGETW